MSNKKYQAVYAYVDNQKRKIGYAYAYATTNGSLCIKGDKILDKIQLGRLLVNGLYIQQSNP